MEAPILPYLAAVGSPELSTAEQLDNKTAFFLGIALGAGAAMELHVSQGNLVRDPSEGGQPGKREWGNVTEHCIVVATRVKLLAADLLDLPADIERDVVKGAVAHDFYKQAEIAKLNEAKTKGSEASLQAFADAQIEAEDILRKEGFSERVISFATSVGHETVPRAEELATQESLSEEGIAWLVVHYVDDYTINNRWVKPAAKVDGEVVNDLTRRLGSVINGPAQPGGKYQGVSLPTPGGNGETYIEAQLRVGRLVERRLERLVAERSGLVVEPKHLPEFVDRRITEKIVALTS